MTPVKPKKMKNLKTRQTSVYLASIFLCITLIGNSQDAKLTRQEKKAVKETQMAINYYVMDSVITSKGFVLEADLLRNQNGDNIVVTPSLNFIKVDKTAGILQTGSNTAIGYNGVGGVTAEGSLGRWEVSRNPKKLSFTVQFSLLTNIGNYDVLMTVTAANQATATITGSGAGKLTWQGHLRALNNTRVFKGQNTY
jgi:hypothetical protein